MYYAKDKKELLDTLTLIHKQYKSTNEEFKKHIFIIEPAYITKKEYKEEYNVTGRAFVTLIYDNETKALEVKVTAAKWMFPLAPMQKNKTRDQMFSNIKNSIKWENLTTEELTILSRGILNTYKEAFKAGFQNNNLMTYCHDHPVMKKFVSCLRPNAVYARSLNTFYPDAKSESKSEFSAEDLFKNTIASVVIRDNLNHFDTSLAYSNYNMQLFTPADSNLDMLMIKICRFSFFENYVSHIKQNEAFYRNFAPQLVSLSKKQVSIKSTLDQLITRYLTLKDKYDIKDMNRALRQAAAIGDLMVIKLLVYSRRADINALSPSNKTALDYALTIKDNAEKDKVINLLKQIGAQKGEQRVSAVPPRVSRTY